jgi:hypothetical protein
MGRVCSTHEEKFNVYRVSVGNPEGKRPLERPRRIKMDLREIGWGSNEWIDLVQDRDRRSALMKTVMNLRVLYNVGKFLSSFAIGGF